MVGRMRFLAVMACSAAVVGVGASAAFAGEVKGPPRTDPGSSRDYTAARTHANSICAYSGLNDNPLSTNPMNPPGRVQSYGFSVVSKGLKDVVEESPGDSCQGGSNPRRA